LSAFESTDARLSTETAGDVYSVLSYRDKLLRLENIKLAADEVPHVLVPPASVRDGVLIEAHDAYETIGAEALQVATFTFAQVAPLLVLSRFTV
jgi:hypothetical protein